MGVMDTPQSTRGRHVWKWLLGAGLVFVVVSAMALQSARRRAYQHWVRVVQHWVDNQTRFLEVVLEHHNEMTDDLELLESYTVFVGGGVLPVRIQDHREFTVAFPPFHTSSRRGVGARLRVLQVQKWFGERVLAECYFTEPWHEALLEELSSILDEVDVELTVVDMGVFD